MTIVRIRVFLVTFLGVFEALLIGRLVVLLLAANPENPFVALLLAWSAPLAAPLAVLDVHQPAFGSRFERGTLLMIFVLAGVGYGFWLLAARLGYAWKRERFHDPG
ncbi:MAG: hypothetical protein KatS3mg057_2942 [Herpetosiphonaceae bacterium]|nr:MAG: hypothetical protein KatS3mg057_2942 [Herpetosiphonaceae bacterium]